MSSDHDADDPTADPNAATVYNPKSAAPASKPGARAAPPPAIDPTPASSDEENATMHIGQASRVARRRTYPWPLSFLMGLPVVVRLLVLLFMGLGLAGAAMMFMPGDAPAPTGPPPAPTQADRLTELLGQARQSFADKQYAVAAATFEAVANLDPANAEAKAGVAKAKAADADQAILDSAQKLVSAKQYGDARAALGKIPSTSPLAAAARTLWTQADQEESHVLFAQGMEQLKQGKTAEVKATIAKLKPLDDTLTAKLMAALDDAKH